MNEELLAKARAAKSPEELLKTARENGMGGFTEENAKICFERLHKSGELSDEELDVSAGGCFDDPAAKGMKKVSKTDRCRYGWKCKNCAYGMENCHCFTDADGNTIMSIASSAWFICCNCMYATCIGGSWYCTNPNPSK